MSDNKGRITKTLMKIRDKIKPLLLEMYPDMSELISFHHQEGFNEWFGMLFKLKEWQLRTGMIDIKEIEMSESRIEEVQDELYSYEGWDDYGYISTVEIEGKLHLIDGYHRVLVARNEGMLQLKGCVWKKGTNDHENCGKIKNLIIENL